MAYLGYDAGGRGNVNVPIGQNVRFGYGDGPGSGPPNMPAFQNFGNVGLHGEVEALRQERLAAYNQGHLDAYRQFTRELTRAVMRHNGNQGPNPGRLQGQF